MAVAKVILNGTTLIDTTQKTVTAASMLNGITALKNDGTDITGSIASKTSSDLTESGDTITAPAGYYASSASKAVSSGSASTPATTITANPSISVSSGGLITASVSASQSVTPTVSAGYVSSGTAGTVSVSGSNTSQLTTQAAQTIHPSATDQTIASGKYLTGAQTVLGVLLSNLTAENIKKDVVVKVGDSTDDDCVTSVTGTYEGGGGGLQIYSSTYNDGAWSLPQGVTLADMTSNVKAITMTNVRLSGGIDTITLPRLGGTYDSNNESLFFGGLIIKSDDAYMFAIATTPYLAGSFSISDIIVYSFNESDFVYPDLQADSVDFIK